MAETMTITSKDNLSIPKIVNISSFFDSQVETKTIRPKTLKEIFGIMDIDDEMRDIENAAMIDFWKFEAMD